MVAITPIMFFQTLVQNLRGRGNFFFVWGGGGGVWGGGGGGGGVI